MLFFWLNKFLAYLSPRDQEGFFSWGIIHKFVALLYGNDEPRCIGNDL
jgi:hypothetical protein